jgi:thiamine biosynthesis lipoprotein
MMRHLVIIWLFISLSACKEDSTTQVIPESFTGQTMGTYYSIKIPGNNSVTKSEIEDLLHDFNMQLSTYIDSSFISRVNDPLVLLKTSKKTDNKWFFDMIEFATEIHESSDGDFDPTVMPLVNYWGFGPNRKQEGYKQEDIDSILQFVGFDKIQVKENEESKMIFKTDRAVSLDFSAIAKGYGVDLVAELIDSKGMKNYLVEIGGETKTKGTKPNDLPWTLGINKPAIDAELDEILIIVKPGDHSMASSGNYRNYYQKDGQVFAHTIDPKSGMAIGSDLLAITVIAEDCWKADAIATACMVKGLKKSKVWIESLSNVEACFFYARGDSIAYDLSSQFNNYIYNKN